MGFFGKKDGKSVIDSIIRRCGIFRGGGRESYILLCGTCVRCMRRMSQMIANK